MPERWQRIESLFLAAADLAGESRQRFLDEHCADDASLRSEVEALLHAEEPAEAARSIQSVIAAVARAVTEPAATRAGERVGSYRLLRELGHGGMGTVYLAERADDVYRAHVAIKFVRGSLASPGLERRLREERQILADLTHPGIARLLDGGSTTDGTPFLVMEYVDGQPIDAWCDQRGLGLRDRLELFARVCDAMQAAHEARVVHRDLKPSNILVDVNGMPKLVDFGIARLLETSGAADQTTTMRMLTPSYASPELLRGDPITFAADVYALGAVLYTLVAGRPPFELGSATMGEIERRICNEAPAPPSAVARVAHAWRRELQTGPDRVVLKALSKEPGRRFASAAELASAARREVQRIEFPEPPTPYQRITRFARQHPVALVAAVVVLALSGSWSGIAIRNDRRQAHALAAGQFSFLTEQQITPPIPAPFETRLADVNGDARADLIFNHHGVRANVVAVALAREDGSFADPLGPFPNPFTPNPSWARYELFVADITGDGRADLIWNHHSSENIIYTATSDSLGSFRFHPLQRQIKTGWPNYHTLTADLDGDGDHDLLWNHRTNQGNYLYTALSNGDGTFALDTTLQTIDGVSDWTPHTTLIGDLDRDGRADLIWAPPQPGRVYTVRSIGNGMMRRLELVDQPGGCCGGPGAQVLMGDFTRDQSPDVLWSWTQGSVTKVQLAVGSADRATWTFRDAQLLPRQIGSGPLIARAADVDGDGASDVLWLRSDAHTNYIASGRGTPGGVIDADLTPPQKHPVRSNWNSALPPLIADVDADGRADIAWVIPGAPARVYVALSQQLR